MMMVIIVIGCPGAGLGPQQGLVCRPWKSIQGIGSARADIATNDDEDCDDDFGSHAVGDGDDDDDDGLGRSLNERMMCWDEASTPKLPTRKAPHAAVVDDDKFRQKLARGSINLRRGCGACRAAMREPPILVWRN